VPTEIKCLRCHSPMEEGFMVDIGHMTIQQARWCRGKPNPSFWSGEVANRQMTSGSRVSTYRCPKCGYLESYAPPDPEQAP
jgi:hypothetical protein